MLELPRLFPWMGWSNIAQLFFRTKPAWNKISRATCMFYTSLWGGIVSFVLEIFLISRERPLVWALELDTVGYVSNFEQSQSRQEQLDNRNHTEKGKIFQNFLIPNNSGSCFISQVPDSISLCPQFGSWVFHLILPPPQPGTDGQRVFIFPLTLWLIVIRNPLIPSN